MSSELDFRFPAEPDHLRNLRQMLREGLAAMGVDEIVADRVLLVVDEIVSNAIEHGADYRQGEEPLRARVQLLGDQRVFLQFEDRDMPSEALAQLAREVQNTNGAAPTAELERGRGLFLVRELMVDLEVHEMIGGGMLLEGWLS